MDIYVHKNGQQQGPYPEVRIRQGIDTGELKPDDLAWTLGKASWQPLSALINLDVTKPPPMPGTATSVDSLRIQDDCAKQISSEPLNVSRLNTATPKSKSPLCKACGAPYNRWSLFHVWGSGLCRNCSKTRLKKRKPGVLETDVSTFETADKVIRIATWVYVVVAVISFFLGDVWIAVAFAVCVLALVRFNSRIAAVILFLLTSLGLTILLCTVDLINQGFIRVLTGLMSAQMVLAFKTVEATFWLQQHGSQNIPPQHSQIVLPKSVLLSMCGIIATVVIVGALAQFDMYSDRVGALEKERAHRKQMDENARKAILAEAQREGRKDDSQDFSVEAHRHMFDPTPTP